MSSHHHTVERWHSHSQKYYCCKYMTVNELPALESLCSFYSEANQMRECLKFILLE